MFENSRYHEINGDILELLFIQYPFLEGAYGAEELLKRNDVQLFLSAFGRCERKPYLGDAMFHQAEIALTGKTGMDDPIVQ